ncbi:MAG: peptidylprolyl isomerase [Bacteriovoracales bacterium]|nr:peptidylprolyl isomerase [Bacteriovoracales bacterium]
MKSTLFLIILFLHSVAFAKKDPVLVTVNGKKIYKSEFLKAYRQSKLFVSNQVVTKKKVLDDLVSKAIGVQIAKKNKLDRDPIVVEKIEDILYHAQISKDLENQLKKIKVSDIDVKNYYKKNKEYRTAQILLRTKANATPKEINKTLRVAQEIRAQVVKNPDKFGELANKYSQAGNSKTGGDMGFLPPMRYAPQYFSAINGQKIGHITSPIKTQFGFHIVKILGIKKFKDINLGVYKKAVYDKKRNAILKRYFKGLRKKARIVVNEKVLSSLKEI